jgi:DNA topoisomerase-1
VERERQIREFLPQEYWEIDVELKSSRGESFMAKLEKIKEKKPQIKNKEEADLIVEDLKDREFFVLDIREKEIKKNPHPPFITSTLQQEAFNRLRFTANKTMFLAQQLYEGINLGKLGILGLITYMRTDSVKVSESALREVRRFIEDEFGKDFLPSKPNIYKSKKLSQEAHEAIRPTSVERRPESIREFLTEDQYKLYELIYKRFLASQMKPAVFSETVVDIKAEKYLFKARGERLIFEGFRIVYETEFLEKTLPTLEKDEVLKLVKILPSQHFTKPPSRFTDSSLVKTLEEKGVGRPSTYAPIIQTLVQRNYVNRQKGYFYPTELGIKVNDLLVSYFPKIIDVEFTAKMEEELDNIERGKFDWVKVLNDFYPDFKKDLEFAIKSIKKEVIPTDKICDKCGRPMLIRWSRKGKFLSCSGFPKCKNAKPITTGLQCPNPECDGELIERHTKKGIFYGCTKYPKCKYITERLPWKDTSTNS